MTFLPFGNTKLLWPHYPDYNWHTDTRESFLKMIVAEEVDPNDVLQSRAYFMGCMLPDAFDFYLWIVLCSIG